MSAAPSLFTWTEDGVFRPARRFEKDCDAHFVIGQWYVLDVVDEAQTARDKAFHCELRDIYSSLPEQYDGRWQQYDEFRGHCLVKCRYAFVRPIPCGSAAAAKDVAAAVGSIKRKGYSIVSVQGTVVHVIQAMSQAIRGGDMTKEQRYESYKDVTDYAKGLVGVKGSHRNGS